MKERIGDLYQQTTKYDRQDLTGWQLDWDNKPATFKLYSSARRQPLSRPQDQGGPPIWSLLAERRSIRRFAGTPLTEQELSQLLWASQGITARSRGYSFRTAPSAGALYPVETYLVVHSVQGVEPGTYHYAVEQHALEQLRTGDLRLDIARAALDQPMAAQGSVVFVWTGVFGRSKWKYRQRAYRYVYLDAGHIAQNLALAAVALGLGSCQIAALYDEEANALLEVDGTDESTLYMTVVGRLP
jgi:SagB-type dehydrogenase family enzyme